MTCRHCIQALWLLMVVLSGFVAGFIMQAASPDYHKLFWSSLKPVLLHTAISLSYFASVRHWSRWICPVITLLVFCFLAEFAARLWLR